MRIIRLLVILFVLGMPGHFYFTAYAGEAEVSLYPEKINPGDAFAVRVSGIDFSVGPRADFNKRTLLFGTCGPECFVAIGAVDLDAEPGNYQVDLRIDDEQRLLMLTVEKGQFPEHHLSLPDEKVFLSPDDLQRAQREAEKLGALWPVATDRLWSGSFVLPVENEISTAFGEKRVINKRKNSRHTGVDIRGKTGEEVKAANTGKVVLAEELFFGGNTVVLDHGQGIYTIYMHLSSLETNTGALVSKGALVGLVGSTGRSTGPHLHFGAKVNSLNVNPLSLIRLPLSSAD